MFSKAMCLKYVGSFIRRKVALVVPLTAIASSANASSRVVDVTPDSDNEGGKIGGLD